MGEWEKKVGEKGEAIVGELSNLIGWRNAQNNLTLGCIKGKNHGTSKTPKTTHGIDHFISYPSQLVTGTLDNIVISDKCTSNPYPSSISSKYREHHDDLAMTLECFRHSEIRKNACNNFPGIVTDSREVGVLFWISLSEPEDKDVISQIARVRKVDSYNYKTIYVVDNKRASFIYNTIKYLENLRPNSEIEFLYQNTGKNNSFADRLISGKILPVDFVNAGILLIKLTHPNNTNTLVISIIDGFDKNNCKRLMGLALDLAHGFANNSLILFADYNSLTHDNQVKEVKSSFVDSKFVESVIVSSFHDDFRDGSINIRRELDTNNFQQQEKLVKLDLGKEFLGSNRNIKQRLPYGEMLRVLLQQSYISSENIKDLLRHRGVFSYENDKRNTIPLLLTTVITPNEFDFLRENQSTKEDNIKKITRIIELETESSLIEIIPENLNICLIANPEFANYKVVGKPEFIIVGSNPNYIEVDISVERIDKHKSWADDTNIFSASLELTKIPETNKVQVVINHTAQETKTVLGKVASVLVKNFKDNGYMAKDSKPEKMIFSSFTNTNRFNFVFAITKSISTSSLEFIDIVDAKFSLDRSQDLPENIDWMQKDIKSFKLSGNKLHRTLFLKKENHSFIHIHNIDSKFKFNFKLNELEVSGECVISVGFPYYEADRDNTDSEIEINVKSLSFKDRIKGCNKFRIKQVLLKEIEKQKIINFDKYKISTQNSVAIAI